MSSANASTVVLTDLLRHAPTSRKEVADRSGLSQATVSRAVEQLLATGLIRELGEVVASTPGRRAVQLAVVAERTHVVGVDLGASTVRVVVADLMGTTVARAAEPTATQLDAPALAKDVARQVRDAAAGHWRSVASVVLGIPGSIDRETGAVANANNLPQVEDPRFATVLGDELAVPVSLHNDADLALLGEQQVGAARHADAAAMLTLGTGLGAALAFRGQIVQGRHGIVGELGQLPLDGSTRLEDLLTGPGIIAAAERAGVRLASPASLFDKDADAPVQALRERFDAALLLALTAVTVACEPAVIVLGGRVAESLDGDWERYETALRHAIRYAPRLAPPALGAYSGATGAAVHGLHAAYRALGVADADLIDLPAATNRLP